MAKTALAIVNNRGMGLAANTWLRAAIVVRSPFISTAAVDAEVEQIGRELMSAHVGAVDAGATQPREIARYHHAIFAKHRLGARLRWYLFTGRLAETDSYSGVWISC